MQHCHRVRFLVHRGSKADSVGMTLTVKGTNVVVTGLREDGPLANAGAHIGDILAAINNVPIPYPRTKKVPEEIKRLINSPRSILEFTMIRGSAIDQFDPYTYHQKRSQLVSPVRERQSPSRQIHPLPSPVRPKSPEKKVKKHSKGKAPINEPEPNFPPPSPPIFTPSPNKDKEDLPIDETNLLPSEEPSSPTDEPSIPPTSIDFDTTNNVPVTPTPVTPTSVNPVPVTPVPTNIIITNSDDDSDDHTAPSNPPPQGGVRPVRAASEVTDLRDMLLKIFQSANDHNEEKQLNKDDLKQIIHEDTLKQVLTEHQNLFVTDNDGEVNLEKMFDMLDSDHSGHLSLLQFLRIAKLIKSDVSPTPHGTNLAPISPAVSTTSLLSSGSPRPKFETRVSKSGSSASMKRIELSPSRSIKIASAV